MKVYVLVIEYDGFNEGNGSQILGVYKKREKAEETLKKKIKAEEDYLCLENIKIRDKSETYIETQYGEVNLYIDEREII